MPKSIVRRSVYTILMLVLGLSAAASMFVPHGAAPVISLSFAALGVLVGVAAFVSGTWRREAGTIRHTIVLLATIGCVAIGVMDIISLMERATG